MVRLRGGFAVIADETGDHRLLVLSEAGDIGIAHQVFPVFVVSLRIDRPADVVKQGAELECDPLTGRKPVHRSQLIKELSGQPAHLFAVSCIGVEARGETAGLLSQTLPCSNR